jgi:tetratricopeptide (TPR) repeat protein
MPKQRRYTLGFKTYHILLFAGSIILLAFLCIPPEREQSIMHAQCSHEDESLRILLNILKKNPDDERALRMAIPLLMQKKRKLIAIELLENYYTKHPDTLWAQELLTDLYINLFYYHKALALLNKDRATNHKKIFEILLQTGDVESAIALLKERLDGSKNDYTRWQDIAYYQNWVGNISGVIEALKEQVRISNNTQDISELLETLIWRGMLEDAVPYAKQLLHHPQRRADDERLLITFYVRSRSIPPAIEAAELLCARPEAEISDWKDLAYLMLWSDNPRKALTTIEHILDTYPPTLDIYWMAAECAKELKDQPMYITYLTHVAEISKDGPPLCIYYHTASRRRSH